MTEINVVEFEERSANHGRRERRLVGETADGVSENPLSTGVFQSGPQHKVGIWTPIDSWPSMPYCYVTKFVFLRKT